MNRRGFFGLLAAVVGALKLPFAPKPIFQPKYSSVSIPFSVEDIVFTVTDTPEDIFGFSGFLEPDAADPMRAPYMGITRATLVPLTRSERRM